MFEYQFYDIILMFIFGDHRKQRAGAAFFHKYRAGVYVAGAAEHELFAGECQIFGTHIIYIAGELDDLVIMVHGFTQMCTDAVGDGEVFLSAAVAGGAYLHYGHGPEFICEMLYESSTRRSAELAFNLAAVYRNVFKDISGGGSGNGQYAVCTFYGTASHVYG